MTKKEIKEALLSYVSIKRSLVDMDKVSKLIEAYFAEEPVNDDKWISVEDRLPKPYEEVFIFEGIEVGYGQIDDDGKWHTRYVSHFPVLFWMPIPEPPKTK